MPPSKGRELTRNPFADPYAVPRFMMLPSRKHTSRNATNAPLSRTCAVQPRHKVVHEVVVQHPWAAYHGAESTSHTNQLALGWPSTISTRHTTTSTNDSTSHTTNSLAQPTVHEPRYYHSAPLLGLSASPAPLHRPPKKAAASVRPYRHQKSA